MNDFSKSKKKSGHPATAVRATFSLPSTAIDEIENLRSKFARKGYILNRSELIRAGLAALESLPEKSALKAIADIEKLKAGRPKLN